MLIAKVSKNIQIKWFKESIINTINSCGIDSNSPIKLIDIFINEHLVEDFKKHGNSRKITYILYQKHPFKRIDLNEVIEIMIEQKQIQLTDDLSEDDFILGGRGPGSVSDNEFYDMLNTNINKTFMILPNFNLPADELSYKIQNGLIEKLPQILLPTILEINQSYSSGLNIACGILLRRLLEGSIILKFKQLNKIEDIKNTNEDYFGLEKLINKIFEEPSLTFHSSFKRKILNIKWIGDRVAHGFELNIFRDDIKDNLKYIKEFLELLELKK